MRKRLSSQRILSKSVFFIFVLLVSISLISRFEIYSLFFLIAVILLAGYRLFYLPDVVEFDNEKMYFKDKNGEFEVDLSNIILVSAKTIGVFTGALGKIEFTYEREKHEILFERRRFSSIFKEFTDLVLSNNPTAKIKTTTGPYNINY